MTKKISSITPCYNGGEYLAGFLGNVTSQVNLDEIEIVLDHNAPEKWEIDLVEKFQKEHPGVLIHNVKEHVDNIARSMNDCWNMASGKYVAIWNIDDLRVPNSLKLQADFLDTNPAHGVVHGNFVIVDSFGSGAGRLVDHSQYFTPHRELTRGMVTGPFLMWRKNLKDKCGMFDEQLVSGADFDLSIRLAANSRVGVVNEILGAYLDEGKGASTRPDNKQPLERTVIEMRYGISDKIDQRYVAEAQEKYEVQSLLWYNEKKHTGDVIPDFANFIKGNGTK
jgi:alpha-1,6-rhamnosyltransferase|tara:strand:+ start:3877 stop:4716 length:840 start_codon:yes stop_codon:yes gene_type:complete